MAKQRPVLLAGMLAAFAFASAGIAQDPAPRDPATAQPPDRPFPGSGFGGFGSGGAPRYWNGNEDDNGPWVPVEGGGVINEDLVKTAREVGSHSSGTPNWTNPRGFEKDVFTFTRVVFKSGVDRRRGRRLGWWVDFPDADLNFSYRLQQLTSTKVDPDGRVIKLTDKELFSYPLIYMEHPGYMQLKDQEIEQLRKYFMAGGALLVIDFWSFWEWEGFEAQMQKVLPGRKWVEIPIEHPIFNNIFTIKGPMSKLQVPTMQFWNRAHTPDNPVGPLQVYRGEGSEEMHLRAWLDDKGRIMILTVWNSDVSDGWEREGEDDAYFRVFSEKIAYPLGINVLFYLMTH